jgi:MFS family permease
MLFTWVLFDRVGRRFALIAGLSTQLIAHVYMALYMAIFRPASLSSTDASKEQVNESASDAAIAMVFIYTVGWSIGLCTVPYMYTNEIYSTRHRGLCYSANMAVHWLSQFDLVRALPNMLVTLDVYGAYIFFCCVCGVGLLLLGFWVPETRKVPMERMEEFFKPNGNRWTSWKAKLDSTTPFAGLDGKLDSGLMVLGSGRSRMRCAKKWREFKGRYVHLT